MARICRSLGLDIPKSKNRASGLSGFVKGMLEYVALPLASRQGQDHGVLPGERGMKRST